MNEKLDTFLRTAVQSGSSDLHITVGNKPNLRINGVLTPIKTAPLTSVEVQEIIMKSLTPESKEILEKNYEVDYLYVLDTGDRFRVNAYKSQGSYEAVFRVIKNQVLSLNDLNVPERVNDLVAFNNGLVLVAGATSSGKSTTLAALIHQINQTKKNRIITIENPVEVLHKNINSIISQREIGMDTKDFPTALRSALRQDPDVIVIGEIRDKETAYIALEAAQTGHLVLSTLHASDASDAVNRFINIFPEGDRANTKAMFSDSLRGIIAQRLVRDVNDSRVPLIEVLFNSLRIQDAIKGTEPTPILEIIAASSAYGMQTFEDSIVKLVTSKVISFETARENATEESSLIIRLKKQGVKFS